MPTTAAIRVLTLPDLLTPILEFAATATTTPLDATSHLLRVRRVSKFWCAVVDSAPSLLSLTFRNPRLRRPSSDSSPSTTQNPNQLEPLKINPRLINFISTNLNVTRLMRTSASTIGWSTWYSFVLASSMLPPGPDIYLTQPPTPSIRLIFEVIAGSSWVSLFGDSSKNTEPGWYWTFVHYDICLASPEGKGVTIKMVLDKMVETIETWCESGVYFGVFEVGIEFGEKEEEKVLRLFLNERDVPPRKKDSCILWQITRTAA
ncbi:hypothetical protein AA313_de0205864 [Arthrobotrys entomopaga]|nr:hypothetical protein AA313_de0205864 [Arthrobotrys entomopaga]